MAVKIDNVVEICVALDIALIGIAYPILVDKISTIGQKYNSTYIAELFNNEKLKLPIEDTDIIFSEKNFKYVLYTTLVSFILLIFNFPPPASIDNWFFNNSANLIVITISIIFVAYFFFWLEKVILYVGGSAKFLQYIIDKYKSLPEHSPIKSTSLRAINEICVYAIAKQDTHLQKTLEYFYYDVFKKYREVANAKNNYDYPDEYYFFINNLHYEILNTNNNRLRVIEHRAVSGVWLLGEFMTAGKISKSTYSWLWRNISLVAEVRHFVKDFWGNSYQYFHYSLPFIQPEYTYQPLTIVNCEEVDQRDKERKDFLEFHYTLGGLLLFKKQYDTILDCLSYTQSMPPSYPLLPQSMTEVFDWFDYFRNEYRQLENPIEYKYSFPGLNNMSSERAVRTWICLYIVILFLRQYKLLPHLITQNFTGLPTLPTDLNDLKSWNDSLGYFKTCLNELIKEKETLKKLNLNNLLDSRFEEISFFIVNLENSIKSQISEVQLHTPLSSQKIEDFYSTSNQIISDAINRFSGISNPQMPVALDKQIRSVIQGVTTLFPKSAFTDNDIPHFGFENAVADSAVRNHINNYLPNSFIVARTQRYTVSLDGVLNGLEKLIGENENTVIVGFNWSYNLEERLVNSKFKNIIIKIPSSNYHYKDLLFVLDKNDLPFLEHRDVGQEYIEKLKLTPLNQELNLYGSIVDINLPENAVLKEENSNLDNETDDSLKVLVTLAFVIVINWSKNRKIVQLNISSTFNEEGSAVDISAIQPL